MVRPKITLHYGASNNDIIVDGVCFDRAKLSKKDFGFIRNVVIDTLAKVGSVSRRVAA